MRSYYFSSPLASPASPYQTTPWQLKIKDLKRKNQIHPYFCHRSKKKKKEEGIPSCTVHKSLSIYVLYPTPHATGPPRLPPSPTVCRSSPPSDTLGGNHCPKEDDGWRIMIICETIIGTLPTWPTPRGWNGDSGGKDRAHQK